MKKKETEAKTVEKAKIIKICRQYVDLDNSKTKEQENTSSITEPEKDMEGESEDVNMADKTEQENTSSVTPENEMEGESEDANTEEKKNATQLEKSKTPPKEKNPCDAAYEALKNHVTNISEKVDIIENNLQELKKLLSECKHFLSNSHETR